MLKFVNNIIKITKGDSAVFNVDIAYADGTPYIIKSGDKLKMTVRRRIGSEVLLESESTTNTITLTHDMTTKLVPGNCVYDIELKTSAGEVYTVIGLTDNSTYNMYVVGEVTE